VSGRRGLTHMFRAVWPIDEDGLDMTLAQLAHIAGPELGDLLTEQSAIPIGSWSFRIEGLQDFGDQPLLVAECPAEVVNHGRRPARHLAVAS
jgi:hypothetical protein